MAGDEPSETARLLRVATRRSPLALRQAAEAAAALTGGPVGDAAGGPVATPIRVELVPVATGGDRDADTPVSEMSGRGVFAAEVQHAVLDGRADVAVHSAKDLRSTPTPGLDLVGCLARGDVRDALVGARLDDLAHGATVATGARRRQSQLAALRPDLRFVGLRGNIASRLAAVQRPDVDAVVVAAVALDRLGLERHAAELLDTGRMLPQAGQGAIALECRSDDDATRAALAGVVDPTTSRCVEAERAVLAAFGGGCELPVGALATPGGVGGVSVEALLADLDGRRILRAARTGSDPSRVGTALARHLLDDLGGAELLARYDRR